MPLLTAVPRTCLADWRTFAGDIGRLLLVSRNGGAISPSRQRAARAVSRGCGHLGAMIPDSLMTYVCSSDMLTPKSPVGLLRRQRKQA
ncbi:DUF2478 domain-containing protein [Bradyrhizobium sp. 6(2017)]|uniref:DUF2478 domain-containing protein n=1 Tax=Bradyrhizobium sp. 6(2017) TaxID=1197460 RepID=UPI001FEDD3B5|nr:DUF2478 domain-containing protein [Bradyrhizobium sp. 6(2017)]